MSTFDKLSMALGTVSKSISTLTPEEEERVQAVKDMASHEVGQEPIYANAGIKNPDVEFSATGGGINEVDLGVDINEKGVVAGSYEDVMGDGSDFVPFGDTDVRGGFVGTGPLDNPYNMGQKQEYRGEQLPDMPNHEAVGDLAKKAAEKAGINTGDGKREDEFEFWKAVKGIATQVGKPLKMTFEAWEKLSPSTKMALIGAAGTAYSYNKGWKKTAGDVAQGTANLYGTMYGQEQANERAKITADAAKVKAALDAKNNGAKTDFQQGDREHVKESLGLLLKDSFPDHSFLGFEWGVDDDALATNVNGLVDEYITFTGGNRSNMSQADIKKFLSLKKEAQDKAKAEAEAKAKAEGGGLMDDNL